MKRLATHRYTASLMILLLGIFLSTSVFAQGRRVSSSRGSRGSVTKSNSRSTGRVVRSERSSRGERRGMSRGSRVVTTDRAVTVNRTPRRSISSSRTVYNRAPQRSVSSSRTVTRTTRVERPTRTVYNRRSYTPVRRSTVYSNRVVSRPTRRTTVVHNVRRPWPVVVHSRQQVRRPVYVARYSLLAPRPYVTYDNYYEWDTFGTRWLITETVTSRPGRLRQVSVERTVAPEPLNFYWNDGLYCEEVDNGNEIVEVCEDWDD